jgi:hypothetical protein
LLEYDQHSEQVHLSPLGVEYVDKLLAERQ